MTASAGTGTRPPLAKIDPTAVPTHSEISPPPPPDWVSQAARRLPERVNDQGPTHGWAFNTHGRPLSAEPWSSGRNVASTDGLRPLPGTNGWPWTLTDHVESKVAETMRQPDAPREVILVINNDPCIDSPYGCDRLVRHLIPAGSRLTVYVRDSQTPNGARLFKVYDGTGKGIKP